MKHTEFSGSVLYERKQVDKWETWKQSRQNGKTKELAKRSRYYQSMIDLQLIDKGQLYDELKRSYVIFICPFDLYGKGRHIYTFENICKEDGSISMGDEAVKIFLNAKGTLDDVSDELEAFLDYMAGKKTKDAYVERLEEAVKEAKKNREWRHEYMTLLMRDQENVKIGEKRGEEKMLMLMERLIKDKRFDDIARIKVDNGYRQKLYLEYHII
nr:Rpn family recombination-promoting nuclease/putative transposase [uncultured Acetatifactor sp.]